MDLLNIKTATTDMALEIRHIEGSAHLKPLVFLHEGLGSVSQWTHRGLDWPASVCAATGRTGLVYSRAGYGQSPAHPQVRPEGSATGRPGGRLQPDYMQREAWAVLPALLSELKIDRPVLVGHSDGATIALLHASKNPVTACIAMAPHVFVEDVALKSISEAKTAYDVSASQENGLRARLSRHHHDVDGAFWQWNDVWLSDGFRSFDIRSDCRRITAPLLALQGRGDEYGTLAQLDEIAAAAPNASTLVLEDCGHSPQRDQPGTTREAIASFIRDLD